MSVGETLHYLPDPYSEAQQEARLDTPGFSYTLADGTEVYAETMEDAIGRCKFLAELPPGVAHVMLQLSVRGKKELSQEDAAQQIAPAETMATVAAEKAPLHNKKELVPLLVAKLAAREMTSPELSNGSVEMPEASVQASVAGRQAIIEAPKIEPRTFATIIPVLELPNDPNLVPYQEKNTTGEKQDIPHQALPLQIVREAPYDPPENEIVASIGRLESIQTQQELPVVAAPAPKHAVESPIHSVAATYEASRNAHILPTPEVTDSLQADEAVIVPVELSGMPENQPVVVSTIPDMEIVEAAVMDLPTDALAVPSFSEETIQDQPIFVEPFAPDQELELEKVSDYIQTIEEQIPNEVLVEMAVVLESTGQELILETSDVPETYESSDVAVVSLQSIRHEVQAGLPLGKAVMELGIVLMQEQLATVDDRPWPESASEIPRTAQPDEPEIVTDRMLLKTIVSEVYEAYEAMQNVVAGAISGDSDPAQQLFIRKFAVLCVALGYERPDAALSEYLRQGSMAELMQGISCIYRLIENEEYKEIIIDGTAAAMTDVSDGGRQVYTLFAQIGRALLRPAGRSLQPV